METPTNEPISVNNNGQDRDNEKQDSTETNGFFQDTANNEHKEELIDNNNSHSDSPSASPSHQKEKDALNQARTIGCETKESSFFDPKQEETEKLEQLEHEINCMQKEYNSVIRQLKYMKDILATTKVLQLKDSSSKDIKSLTLLTDKNFKALKRTCRGMHSALYFANGISYVYVLELKNNNYYVGYSEQLETRFEQHFNGEGSEWTKLHRPIRVIEVVPADKSTEKTKTIEYMKKYGVEHVRGSYWCQVILRNRPAELS